MSKPEKPEVIETGDPTRIGYARVSTADQSLDLQVDALREAGCGRIYKDQGVSGATSSRKGLNAALAYMREGDTLVVWKLDRLGRSTAHLVGLVEQFDKEGKHLHVTADKIDTSTPAGRMVFTIMSAVAQMERDLTRERTRAGLEAARARGRKGGRKPKLDHGKRSRARQMRDQGATLNEIAGALGVSRATIIRTLQANTTIERTAP